MAFACFENQWSTEIVNFGEPRGEAPPGTVRGPDPWAVEFCVAQALGRAPPLHLASLYIPYRQSRPVGEWRLSTGAVNGLLGHRTEDRQVPAQYAGKQNFYIALVDDRLRREPTPTPSES